ncbi:unnamed protein product [Didymodactylos carnosus]|uniref:Uncharacterized protein n=1 Tax=Didymodactylos carnosus TaxID=1234261 RepID=A0A815XH30_9BILA|nr:unnamed protein product [Didymodactylos carnosus]CAF4418659.1 unnamed protein product [Didymodactylos carnosus]
MNFNIFLVLILLTAAHIAESRSSRHRLLNQRLYHDNNPGERYGYHRLANNGFGNFGGRTHSGHFIIPQNNDFDGLRNGIDFPVDDDFHGVTGSGAYTQDAFNVYYNGKKVEGLKALFFKDLGYGYAKDNWDVWLRGRKIPGAKASSFELLEDGYAKDTWTVYFMGKPVEGLKPIFFKNLGKYYRRQNTAILVAF